MEHVHQFGDTLWRQNDGLNSLKSKSPIYYQYTEDLMNNTSQSWAFISFSVRFLGFQSFDLKSQFGLLQTGWMRLLNRYQMTQRCSSSPPADRKQSRGIEGSPPLLLFFLRVLSFSLGCVYSRHTAPEGWRRSRVSLKSLSLRLLTEWRECACTHLWLWI